MNKYFALLALLFFSACAESGSQVHAPVGDTTPAIQAAPITTPKKLSGGEFISELSRLGYFDYTDKTRLKMVQDSLKARLSMSREFLTEQNHQQPFQFYDARFYSCGDGEELYEEGGAVSLLEEMKPFLQRLGIPVNYSNDSYLNGIHSMVLNGTTYYLAVGSPLMWGETIQKFAEMLNAELAKHHSNEQIYICQDETVYMVFLTKEQYELVMANFLPDKRPLPASEWATKALNDMKEILNQ